MGEGIVNFKPILATTNSTPINHHHYRRLSRHHGC